VSLEIEPVKQLRLIALALAHHRPGSRCPKAVNQAVTADASEFFNRIDRLLPFRRRRGERFGTDSGVGSVKRA
jgi:hypothetical protein